MIKKFVLGLVIIVLLVTTIVIGSKMMSGGLLSQKKADPTGDTSVESLESIAAAVKGMSDREKERKLEEKLAAQDLAKEKERAEAEKIKAEKEREKLEKTIGGLSNELETMAETGKQNLKEYMASIEKMLGNQLQEPASDSKGTNVGDDGWIWIKPSYKSNNTIQPLVGTPDTSVGSRAKQLLDGYLNTASAATDTAMSVLLPGGGGQQNNTLISRRSTATPQQELESLVPVYTIPANSTLFDTRSMSALIGRVPTAGTVRFPFRFKVIAGKENLISNDIKLPGVEKSVWSGYVFGDRTLHCNRGIIDTVTFTFTDGRIYTKKSEPRENADNTNNAFEDGDALGWISSDNGSCIAGEFVSNAPENLAKIFAAGAAAGAANAISLSQREITTDGGRITSVFSGSASKYALSEGGSEGFDAVADFVINRAKDDFDVVYSPSGTPTVINITNDILLDYNTNGRKVSYYDDYEIQNSTINTLD